MFRFSLTEKHLLFIPTLLLASQIYYRIMFLQAAEAPEVVAFNIVPTALASLAIGIFFIQMNILESLKKILNLACQNQYSQLL